MILPDGRGPQEMSFELIDKGVSTEDLEAGFEPENEKKPTTTDYEKFEAVLSVLVENKVVSMREYNKNIAEKRRLFGRFRTRSEEGGRSEIKSKRASSNSSLTVCQHRSRSIIPQDVVQPHKIRTYLESLDPNPAAPPSFNHQQSFDSCEASKHSDSCCCSQKEMHRRKQSTSCLPKKLTTQQWLLSTSRQASTETATTSSGYISPTSGMVNKGRASGNQTHESNETTKNEDDTIIESARFEAQRPAAEAGGAGGADNKEVIPETVQCAECGEEYLPSECRFAEGGEGPVVCCHTTVCCDSPAHSIHSKLPYDETSIAIGMNLDDLEFEKEEERRKRKKRKKKRMKERLARSRGFIADEIKTTTTKVIDPDDLPQRARWAIGATACLLLLMSLLLVGATLRMAPFIDDMVREKNLKMFNSLNRHGSLYNTSRQFNVTAG